MARINIDLDNQLLQEALHLSHLQTKKAVLHLALTELVKKLKRRNITKFMGSGIWEGSLEKQRSN